MTTIVLKKREETGKGETRRARRAGEVPGVIYGEAIPGRHFILAESIVKKLLQSEGKSGLFDVQFEGDNNTVKAILHDYQNDVITGRPRHIDLYQVRMDKTLRTEISIHFIGVSAAVKDLGGTLVKQINALPIECLPGDLIHNFELNIESLKTFDDIIRVKDLVVPTGIKIMLDPEEIVAAVSAPRTDAELESLKGEVKADVSAVEVLTEKKKEGEEAEVEEKK